MKFDLVNKHIISSEKYSTFSILLRPLKLRTISLVKTLNLSIHFSNVNRGFERNAYKMLVCFIYLTK